jgi:hypothetical protein
MMHVIVHDAEPAHLRISLSPMIAQVDNVWGDWRYLAIYLDALVDGDGKYPM